jgi:hypothetical protein
MIRFEIIVKGACEGSNGSSYVGLVSRVTARSAGLGTVLQASLCWV